jgi:hypothetical protein
MFLLLVFRVANNSPEPDLCDEDAESILKRQRKSDALFLVLIILGFMWLGQIMIEVIPALYLDVIKITAQFYLGSALIAIFAFCEWRRNKLSPLSENRKWCNALQIASFVTSFLLFI